MRDGIGDGIHAEIVFGCPMLVNFQRKRRLILQCSLSKADNLPAGFSGIADGIVDERMNALAEPRPRKGTAIRLTTEWE